MTDEEQSEKEQQGENQTNEDKGSGDQQQETSPIDRANAAAERLEAANKKSEEVAKRLEDLKAREALGGKSQGAPQEKKQEEDDPQTYAEKALKGQI